MEMAKAGRSFTRYALGFQLGQSPGDAPRLMEIWRRCMDFSRYEVSNLGRVRRIDSGMILKITSGWDGYPQVSIGPAFKVDGRGKDKRTKRMVARLVMLAFYENGPWPQGLVIRYRDGNRKNCAYENLYWGTRSEVIKGHWEKGAYKKRDTRTYFKFSATGPANPRHRDYVAR